MSKKLLFLTAFVLILVLAGNWTELCRGDWPDNVGLLFGSQGIEPGDPSQGEAPPGKTNWYVNADAPGGGNGSYANPYNSFEQVCGWMNGSSYVQGQIQGGDYLYVKGTFSASDHTEGSNNMNIRIGRAAQAGTASEPTVIKSWLGSPRAVFDCEYQKSDIIHLHSNTNPGGHFVIQNIEVKRADGRGIYIADNILGCEVISSVIRDTHGDGNMGVGGGILFCFWTNEPHHIIRNSLIYNNDVAPEGVSGNRGGISILSEPTVLTGAYIDIYENEIYDECNAVRHKHSGNIICRVYNNIIHDSDAGTYLRGFNGNYVHHNIMYNLGTGMFHYQDAQQDDSYSEFYNNTLYNVTKVVETGLGDSGGYRRDFDIHDNIYYNDVETSDWVIELGRWSGSEYPIEQWASSYNTYYYLSSRTTFLFATPNSYTFAEAEIYLDDSTMFTFDPLFVDAPNLDFHLQPTSPALGAGTGGGDLGALGESGTPQPPGQASNPSPGNGATSVSVSANLSWSAGSGKTSSDVYFGTDSTPDSGEFQGNQTTTTFDPGTMSNNTTYYWRIDEVNAQGTTTGNVWNFTTEAAPTPPGQASNPSPADSATDVSNTAILSWTAGSSATSRDVYFGTSSPGDFQGNQAANTFDPGTMANDTTYYWRIDEINAVGTTTGNVWSFTTEADPSPPSQATNPDPADSATDVSVETDLSWTAGTGSTSSDVYFGTTSPGAFQGNQTATTFDTGTMDYDTTYYWRIDEVNANGTTTGNVWSFTTIVAGAPVTVEFGDAVDTNYPGTIEDTFTNAGDGGDDNWSTDVTLNTYTWPADTVANTTIIEWDLTAISTDATVTQATLYLYQVVTGGDTSYDIGVYKIINVNPVISSLTWNTYDGTNSWTGGADGGQADTAAAEDTPSVNSTNNEYKTWTVTNMVADWVAAPSNNFGMLVNSDDVASVDSYRTFASTEVVDASIRPKLIVTYSTGAAPPGQASNPDPADSAADVSITADLTWNAGTGSTSSDVYFGTTSPGTFQGNQTATTFDPGTMANDTTYYWRIDEVNTEGTTTGNVWSFTTIVAAPGQASNPSPANGAANVNINANLTWTAGSGATSHDVYFGTSSPGTFQGNQTAATFDPGTMANDTTYYWRIDEINAGGTTTGTAWSFTTIVAAPGQASSPSPADSATDVAISADLSWTAGSGAASHDVYFGTSSPGSYQGNQAANTFDPGTMANDTTYYWRIDEVNAGGTTTGSVWSFTTEAAPVPPPGQADNPTPADSAANVAVNTDLSWTAGSDTTSHDVYFGTSSPGAFQGNQAAATFDTGTMDNDTTYYWRIDEVGLGGTTTGNVWSFTTIVAAPGQASNPSPGNGAADVSINADLSWSAGSGATSHDVYFGTSSPGAFQGNQTSTTFDTGTMANDTTYYWRIDELNAAGTTTGSVWSFTTIVSTGDQIIGWWQLDEGSGNTAADSSTYANDGTILGNTAWTDDAERGWCLDFPGNTTDYVTIPNESDYDLTGNMTVMAWMKAGYIDWRNFSTIIAKGKDGQGGWALQKASRANAMSFWIDVSGMPWDGIKAGVGIFDNQWHHVAGVYDGSNAYIYIDGGLDSNSVSCSGSISTNDWDVYIGLSSVGMDRSWEDLISDVCVYNYALTQSEINDIYTGGPTPPDQASNPSPADSATDVSITADLSWTAGADATSHDVYFGTSSPGAFQGNQTATTYDTGTMSNDTTYYWRIDEINTEGTTTGVVWSFTTESAGLLPWTDGFESGDLVTGGWTTSGNASASDKAEYTGTYGAAVKGTAWMEKAISTAGFTSIHVKYVRKTKGLDSGEYLYIEYHDGTQWNELEATQATSWASQDKTCGSGADNNADFKIRFRTNANRANEYAYIDDVEITGTSQ